MRSRAFHKARAGAAAALCLLAIAPQAIAQNGCAPPRPWSEATARQGQPRAEVSACLKGQAWEIRDLKIPLRSAAAGIVAQCEVRVTFAAGPEGSDARFRVQRALDAVDAEIVAEAAAVVTHYRSCLGR